MTRLDDAQLLDRFNRHLAAIEAEVPSPPGWRGTVSAYSARGRFQSMFSVTKLVAAGAIVALFAGVLVIARPAEQQVATVPGAASRGPGTFAEAGSLIEPRFGHTLTLLPDGRVLVVGGTEADASTVIASAEVWDPATASFEPAGSLAQGRTYPTATLLLDGRVLIVGGFDWEGENNVFASAEIWDPATASFSPAGEMSEPLVDHTAALLPDSRVLVIGGSSSTDGLSRAEIWHPATESFSPAGSLTGALSGVSATLLPDGRILLIGSSFGDEEDDADDRTEARIWDPTTGTSTPAGSLAGAPYGHHARLLPDGRVLVLDGGHGSGFEAQVWDPATESFGSAAPTDEAAVVSIDSATVLTDGQVLILGSSEYGPNSTEIWDPVTETFTPADSYAIGLTRMIPTATLLSDGRVLVVGGGSSFGLVGVAEVWTPGGG